MEGALALQFNAAGTEKGRWKTSGLFRCPTKGGWETSESQRRGQTQTRDPQPSIRTALRGTNTLIISRAPIYRRAYPVPRSRPDCCALLMPCASARCGSSIGRRQRRHLRVARRLAATTRFWRRRRRHRRVGIFTAVPDFPPGNPWMPGFEVPPVPGVFCAVLRSCGRRHLHHRGDAYFSRMI
jgi:hypothetical protein